MTRQWSVKADQAGGRLDVAAAAYFNLTRSRAQRLIRDGHLLVNAGPAKGSYVLTEDDVVELLEVAEAPLPVRAVPELSIVYQDDDLLVVDKPAGLSVHPGNGREGEATVADFARRYTSDEDAERPGIVHRLDRETSGLLILARNAPAKVTLQELFQSRHVHKTYLLLVVGRVEPAEAIIRLSIDRDPAHPLRRRAGFGGKAAETRYRVKAYYPGYTLIEAKPVTGRTHQLRVHFAALGHSVAGDTVYGSERRPLGLRRQFLHAAELEFVSPSGVPLRLRSPLPADLEAILTMLSDGL